MDLGGFFIISKGGWIMEYPMVSLEKTGRRMKEKVKECGDTTKEIMEYMGFRHPKSIYAWYRGDSLPTLENMIALSVLLHVSVNELIVIE